MCGHKLLVKHTFCWSANKKRPKKQGAERPAMFSGMRLLRLHMAVFDDFTEAFAFACREFDEAGARAAAGFDAAPVSYTHLTLPTNREV